MKSLIGEWAMRVSIGCVLLAGTAGAGERLEFTRMIAHWSGYAEPADLPFVDDVKSEVVQVGSAWAIPTVRRGRAVFSASIVINGTKNCSVRSPSPIPSICLEKDKFGKPVSDKTYSIGGMGEYWACLNNPHWRQVLKAWVRCGISRGVDGFISNYFYRHDCHCEHCVSGFRQYLREQFTAGELNQRFAVTNLDTHQFDEIVTWHDPAQSTPPRREMLRFSQIANKRAFDEVFVQFGRSLKPDLIVAQWNPLRIILFGSRAREDHGADSDLDLLVEMETQDPPAERRVKIRRLFRPAPCGMDILVYTPAEVAARRHSLASLVPLIEQEGKILYEQRG